MGLCGFLSVASRFSTLQRAENSSMWIGLRISSARSCFSTLQRAENSSIPVYAAILFSDGCFSTLQRAENSSIVFQRRPAPAMDAFQYSSASRKFLNRDATDRDGIRIRFQYSSASRKFLNPVLLLRQRRAAARFSTLQRAENSSIADLPRA